MKGQKRHHKSIATEDPMMPFATLINPNGLDEITTEKALLEKAPIGFEFTPTYSSAVDENTGQLDLGCITEFHPVESADQQIRQGANGPIEHQYKFVTGTTTN